MKVDKTGLLMSTRQNAAKKLFEQQAKQGVIGTPILPYGVIVSVDRENDLLIVGWIKKRIRCNCGKNWSLVRALA